MNDSSVFVAAKKKKFITIPFLYKESPKAVLVLMADTYTLEVMKTPLPEDIGLEP